MKKLAKPRKPRKGEDPAAGPYWHSDPELFETLHEIQQMDVAATCEIVQRIGFIPPSEQRLWELDAAINELGVPLDAGLLDSALHIAQEGAEELAAKLSDLSGGAITSQSQTARILAWLGEQNCPLPNLQKPTVGEALKRDDLATNVRELLSLRLDGAGASEADGPAQLILE
jgi:hypothetical protein